MSMNRFATRLAITAVSLTLAAGFTLSAQSTASQTPDHVALTWAEDPQTTQTITWRSSAEVKTGWVQYQTGKSLGSAANKINAQAVEYKNDLGTDELFSITLKGLKPDTLYSYRVGDGKNFSAASTFRTASAKADFKFLVFGDSQSGNAQRAIYDPWKLTVQSAYKAEKDARFFMNVGDLVEIGQMQAHWDDWFDAAKGVIDSIPEMPVQGNHETYMDPTEGQSDKPSFWLAQLPTPQNGPDGLKGQVYSFKYANVDFYVLDSQEDEEMPKYGDILQAQADWLDKALSTSKADFKIVLFHKTPYYNKAARANEAVKAIFTPVIEKNRVDLVLNGHDHGISRTYPVKGDSFSSLPKDGTVYYVTGRSGNKYYNDLSTKFWNAYFYDPQDQPVYLAISVSGKKLTINAKKADGTLVDTYVIDKAGSASTCSPAPAKFNVTRTAVYGSLLGGAAVNPPLAQKNDAGLWFVDLAQVAGYFGAAVSQHDGVADVALGGKTVTLTATDLIAVAGKPTLVSVDALKALGVKATYYADLNVLNLLK
jgi:hypothetical protein